MLIFAYWIPIFPVAERYDETLDPPKIVTGLLLIDSLIARDFNFFKDALLHLFLPGLAIAMPAITIRYRDFCSRPPGRLISQLRCVLVPSGLVQV